MKRTITVNVLIALVASLIGSFVMGFPILSADFFTGLVLSTYILTLISGIDVNKKEENKKGDD